MPATSSRMSASSSTTRTSAAMHLVLQLSRSRPRPRRVDRAPMAGRRRMARAPGRSRGVGQLQLAAMVFQDAFDDRQAQAGALLAGRHIGLGQPVAVLGRQADAIVLDLEGDAVVVGDQPRADAARRAPARRRGGPRSPRRRSSAHWSGPGRPSARRTAGVTSGRRLVELDLDVRARPRAGRRPPARSSSAASCSANFGAGMRAKAENSSTIRPMSPTWRTMVSVQRSKVSRSSGDVLAVLAPQPLGRELDRRQRVLDLVGDAPGDVAPGGVALGGDQAGDVVEGQHQARPRCGWPAPAGAAVSRPRTTSTSSSASPPCARPRPATRGQLRRRSRPASGRAPGSARGPAAGRAWRLTAEMRPVGVEADHAGADPGSTVSMNWRRDSASSWAARRASCCA